jgi:hypothetical protein
MSTQQGMMAMATRTSMKARMKESLSFKNLAKPKSDPTEQPPMEVKFEMNDANAAPIRWQSPNGKSGSR